MDWTEKRLMTLALEELRRVLHGASREAILEHSLVIKEHHATLSPFVGSEALRHVSPQTPLPPI